MVTQRCGDVITSGSSRLPPAHHTPKGPHHSPIASTHRSGDPVPTDVVETDAASDDVTDAGSDAFSGTASSDAPAGQELPLENTRQRGLRLQSIQNCGRRGDRDSACWLSINPHKINCLGGLWVTNARAGQMVPNLRMKILRVTPPLPER